jgi:hypothetical protein
VSRVAFDVSLSDHPYEETDGGICGRCLADLEGHDEDVAARRARWVEAGLVVEVAAGRVVAKGAEGLVAAVQTTLHDGPGPHSGTGSPQGAHGGGGSAGYAGSGPWSFTGGVTNPRTRAAADKGMQAVATRIPSLAKDVTIEVGDEKYADNHPTSQGWTGNNQDTLVSLSPRYVDDPEGTAAQMEASAARGGLVKVPASSNGFERVAVHEMGHIGVNRVGKQAFHDDINREMVRDHGVTVEHLIADSMASDPAAFTGEVWRGLGDYGFAEMDEFIAESFTDGILNGTAAKSPTTETVMRVFDRHFP